MKKSITVLGSTGSIGVQSLDVAEKAGFGVTAVTANNNVEKIEAQIRKFRPKAAALSEEQLREIASRADREAEQKYFADLWRANRIILEDAGVLPQHISVTDVCTACNSEYLFSHRASHGKRGNMGAFLMIEP